MSCRLCVPPLSLCACQAALSACPEGWTEVYSACYRSVPGPADQPTALARCQQDSGAVLPSIHDQATNSILLGLSGNLPFWTGLTNSTGEVAETIAKWGTQKT